MNRKDRRASRKQARSGLAPGLGRGAVSANLFGAAIDHFNAGRLDDAERACRDVLMFDRSHFDALHMLGLIAARADNVEVATELFGRALSINARSAPCHFDLAQVLNAAGRQRDAMAHLTEATALKRDYAAAHLMLADLKVMHNEIDEAQARYEHVLALEPRLVEARHGLANVLRLKGQLAGAAENFRMVVALRPDYAEAYNNLGVVLAAHGQWAEAVEQYQRALALNPQLLDVYRNLARVLLMSGQAERALATVMQGFAVGETEEAKAIFVQCAQEVQRFPAEAGFRDLIARALTEGWGRAAELSGVAATLIASGPAMQAAAENVGPDLTGDRLLRALLESAPVRDVALERFLTAIRSRLLQMASQAEPAAPVDDSLLMFCCALARQCFINDYVFAETDAESAQAAALHDRLDAALASNASASPLWLALCGCYAPLHTLASSEALTRRPWPEALSAVFSQQIQEPATERDIRISLRALTAIEDEVSQKVRRQYEEMPYPRWIRTASVGRPIAVDWYLRGQFPTAPIRPYQASAGLDILIAGCGTGQHAIETARRFAGARVLAIDLSRTSLAYATRKSREAGLRNIQYAQADILKLGALNVSYDVIEAVGVLHHLGEPALGWQVLASLLRPNGFMHVGLYSAYARADIRAARDFIASLGYGDTAAEIRRCRQDLLGSPDGTPLKNVTTFGDFFTTSECRDLLFHVQEHQLTIPQIKAFLDESGLTFLGFTGTVAQAYRRRFPEDTATTDLDRWHTFETENPGAFVDMYQFWVQKPAA